MTMAQDGGKVVSLMHQLPLPPGNTPDTHFYWRLSRPQGHSATGRIKSPKNSNDTIRTRTRDLPVCSIVPSPLRHRAPLSSTCNNDYYLYEHSSVSIVTHYGLDGLEIESWWVQDFTHPSSSGAHPAFCTMGTGYFLGVEWPGCGVNYPLPFSFKVKERVLILPLSVCMAGYWVNFTFTFTFTCTFYILPL
jgi:hypothetical protein